MQVLVFVDESGEYSQLYLSVCTPLPLYVNVGDTGNATEAGSRGEFTRWVRHEVLAGKEALVEKQRREMEEMVTMMKVLKRQVEENERKYQQQYATVLEQGSLIRLLQDQVNSCRLRQPINERA